MSKSLIASLALAAGLLTMGTMAGSASAAPAIGHVHRAAPAAQLVNERGHNERGHFERHKNRGHIEHREHRNDFYRYNHFRRGPVFLVQPSHDGCYWLKRRALNSGSRYWWHRYQECREG